MCAAIIPKRPAVIGIAGASYSGSTILGIVLSGLSGCRFLGEAHWLLDGAKEPWRTGCAPCWAAGKGEFCSGFLTQPEGEAGGGGWLKSLGGRSEKAATVIISEKAAECFEDVDVVPDLVLVPYRPIHDWVYSFVSRSSWFSPSSFIKQADLNSIAVTMAAVLLKTLDWLKSNGIQWLSIDIDEFILAPRTYLSNLCGMAHLPYRALAIRTERTDAHFIGGNEDLIRSGPPYTLQYGKRPTKKWEDHYTYRQFRSLRGGPLEQAIQKIKQREVNHVLSIHKKQGR